VTTGVVLKSVSNPSLHSRCIRFFIGDDSPAHIYETGLPQAYLEKNSKLSATTAIPVHFLPSGLEGNSAKTGRSCEYRQEKQQIFSLGAGMAANRHSRDVVIHQAIVKRVGVKIAPLHLAFATGRRVGPKGFVRCPAIVVAHNAEASRCPRDGPRCAYRFSLRQGEPI
jgi:hypothetical protein